MRPGPKFWPRGRGHKVEAQASVTRQGQSFGFVAKRNDNNVMFDVPCCTIE